MLFLSPATLPHSRHPSKTNYWPIATTSAFCLLFFLILSTSPSSSGASLFITSAIPQQHLTAYPHITWRQKFKHRKFPGSAYTRAKASSSQERVDHSTFIDPQLPVRGLNLRAIAMAAAGVCSLLSAWVLTRTQTRHWSMAQYTGWPSDDTPPLSNEEAFYLANRVPLPNNVRMINKLKFTKKKPDPEENALLPPGLEDRPEVIHPVDRLPELPEHELILAKMQLEELARQKHQAAAQETPASKPMSKSTALVTADGGRPLALPDPGGELIMRTETCKVVVKMAASGPDGVTALKYEAEGLRRLAREASSLHIPRLWDVGTLGSGEAYLIMEHIPTGRARRDYQRRLGRGLAQLHLTAVEYPTFGFPTDGWIGSLKVPNNTKQEPLDWVEFWRKYRLGDQLKRLRRKYPNDVPLQKYGSILMDRIPELFNGIDIEAIKPCLLHGNLDAANILTDPDGNPILLSPATYYGHNEAELGLLRFNGGYTDDFWHAYHQLIPRAGGYTKRIPLYKLNCALNGYLAFGPAYREGAVALIKELLDSLHVYYD